MTALDELPDWVRAAPSPFVPAVANMLAAGYRAHALVDDHDVCRHLMRAAMELLEVVDPVGARRVIEAVSLSQFTEAMTVSADAANEVWASLTSVGRGRIIDAMASVENTDVDGPENVEDR